MFYAQYNKIFKMYIEKTMNFKNIRIQYALALIDS